MRPGGTASHAGRALTRVFCRGRPAASDDLRALALVNYGHFTTLQVRAGAARGLDLHLRRLCEATQELFAHGSGADDLRQQLRAALQADGRDDCTLRATVFAPGFDLLRGGDGAPPRMLVAVSPPLDPAGTALRVRTVCYQREAPHLKHVGTFPLLHQRRLAAAEGVDDALFIDRRERVLEGTTWNIGFIDGDDVVWPQGPALRGVTERLLQAGLEQAGIAQRTRPVGLGELPGFKAAFACNSRGLRMIGAVDGVAYPAAPAAAEILAGAVAKAPWERV